jgi:haloalkane dehalogenase
MAHYRAPFEAPGLGRLPTLVFPRELPIGGEPADVVRAAKEDAAFMAGSEIPKLLILVGEGTGLTKRLRAECRRCPNQNEFQLGGKHFVQEDQPTEISGAIRAFADSVS